MGGGGFLGSVTEMATGGLVKSKKTKNLEQQAADAQAQQAKLVADEKKKITLEEEARKKRTLAGRQGKRSLLWAGTDETGVAKKTTLGG